MLAMKELSLIALAVLSWQLALAAFPVRITDFSCQANADYISQVECLFDTIRMRIQVLSFNVKFLKPLNNVLFRFQLRKENTSNTYEPFIFDITENLCKFLSGTERSAIIGRFMFSLRKHDLLLEKCPLQGQYHIHHYPLDLSLYPSNLPTGNYKLFVQVNEALQQTNSNANANANVLNGSISFAMQH